MVFGNPGWLDWTMVQQNARHMDPVPAPVQRLHRTQKKLVVAAGFWRWPQVGLVSLVFPVRPGHATSLLTGKLALAEIYRARATQFKLYSQNAGMAGGIFGFPLASGKLKTMYICHQGFQPHHITSFSEGGCLSHPIHTQSCGIVGA